MAKKRKPITVFYARVSTVNQSIDSQKAAVYEYANRHKIKIDKEITCEAISAKMDEDKRKITEVKALLQRHDTLIVTSLDRLGRSIHQIVALFNWLAEHEVNFLCTSNDSIRLVAGKDDLTTKILIAVFGILSEVEHRVLTDRIRSGVALAKSRGVVFGRKKGVQMPSRLDGKEEIVKAAIAQGVPKTRIAKDLNISTTALNNWIRSRKVLE